MHKIKMLSVLGCLLIGVQCGVIACTKQDPEGGAPATKSLQAKGDTRRGGPVVVKTVTASFQVLPRSYSAVSPLSGRSQADVFSRVAGRVSFIGPKEGEAVKANQLLFRIDRADPGESFLSTPVVSPISGWVGRWAVANVGEQVTAQDPVVTIVDDSFVRATVFLSTDEWVAINDKSKVTFTINGEDRAGKVVAIARAAEASSGRGSVIVEAPNEKLNWRAGMIARVRIDIDPKQRMIIPSAALIVTDRGSYVYGIEDGKAKRLPIKFEVVDSDKVEVLEGLANNTPIVVAGGNLLSDNAPVQLVTDEAH